MFERVDRELFESRAGKGEDSRGKGVVVDGAEMTRNSKILAT